MNLPNLISLFRIIAAPFLWYLIYAENKSAFAWLITIAFFTDLIDGVIARKTHQVTKLGSKLDSIGDSLTIITGAVGIALFNFDLLEKYIFIIGFVISLHILQLVLSVWRYGKISGFHTWTAKVATLGTGLFILITIHFYFIPWLFYLAMVLLTIDALEESLLVFLIPEWENDVKGIYWWMKKRK